MKGNCLLSMPRKHLRSGSVLQQTFLTSKLNVMIGLLLCTKAYFLEALAATEFIEISLGRQVKMWKSFPKLISFGSTKRPAYPECGDGVISRNVGKKPSHLDMALCPRKRHHMGGVNEVVTDALVAWHHSQTVECLRYACVLRGPLKFRPC